MALSHLVAQRFGNRALQHLQRARLLQAKLTVSRPDDVYEQKADRAADQVMRIPEPTHDRAPLDGSGAPPRIQRLCAECEEEMQRKAAVEDEEPRVQAKREGAGLEDGAAAIAPYVDSLSGRGEPLAPSTRAFMEPRFGVDFSAVRVHTDAAADRSAQSIQALAYTTADHIVFRAGRYDPSSHDGRQLLAHELAHAVQQSASPPAVVQRQGGGGPPPAGGAPAGGAPAGGPAGGAPAAPPFSVKYNGCGTAPFVQADVEAAARAAYNAVATSGCIRSAELRDRILSEFADLEIDCEQKGSNCGTARRFFSNTVNIYPNALTATCGPLESTILHEVVHLTELRLIEHGDLAAACEASCFGFGGGDPTKCNEETLVRHGPRFAVGQSRGAAGSDLFGRVGYEVIRSWTGTAFSLGLHLDVPLTDRESFVRAGLEIGTNFQLLGSLYGRLFTGFEVPLPPGSGQPSTLVGAGLGFDFGRVQLEVLYDVLDIQSKDSRTQELMFGIGFRFGK